MESCSKELALAIQLTKILSVRVMQGKEEVQSSPTAEFFEQLRIQVSSQLELPLLAKTQHFMHRLTQKNYTQLLLPQQEYGLWLALALLPNNYCLQPPATRMGLRILNNLALYLQHQELITQQETASWQASEALIAKLFLYVTEGKQFDLSSYPEVLECHFPAYFMPSALPEETSLDTSPQPISLFEDNSAQKIILNYIFQVIKYYKTPTHLVYVLLELMQKVKITEFETLNVAYDNFKQWAESSNDIINRARLLVLFGKLETAENAPESLANQIISHLCYLLKLNDSHYLQHRSDLFPNELLLELCSVIIQKLSGPFQSTTPLTLKINGFGKETHVEEDLEPEDLCTFNRTGTTYEFQHWYYCYTCKLVSNKGACSVCARRCHKNHDAVYSRKGNFFCDCGDNQGSQPCKSMPKGHHRSRIFNTQDIELGYGELPQMGLSELIGREIELFGGERPSFAAFSPQSPESPIGQLDEQHYEVSPRGAEYEVLSPSYEIQSEGSESGEEEKKESEKSEESEREISSSEESEEERQTKPKSPRKQMQSDRYGVSQVLLNLVKKTLSRLSDFQPPQFPSFYSQRKIEFAKQLTKHLCTFKAFTSQIKVPYNELRDLKEVAGKYPNCRNTLGISQELNLALVVEGNRLITLDASLFYCSGSEVERTNLNFLGRHVFPFQIMSVNVNPSNSRLVAICDVSQYICVLLLHKQHRGAIEKKITVNLFSEQKNPIVKIRWLPNSQTALAACTATDLKIYDFSRDILTPVQVYQSLETELTDFTFVDQNLVVSSAQGVVFSHQIQEIGEPIILSCPLSLPVASSQRISSIEFIEKQNCLFISYFDGNILLGELNSDLTAIGDSMNLDLSSAKSGNFTFNSGGLGLIQSLPDSEHTVLISVSRKNSSIPLLMNFTEDSCQLATLRKSLGNVEGMCLYSVKGKHTLLTQYDDGSLVTHSLLLEEEVQPSNLEIQSLNDWLKVENLPKHVKMPITFFEKCVPLNGMKPFGGSRMARSEVVVTGDPEIVFGNSRIALEKLSFDKNAEVAGIVSSMLPEPSSVKLNIALEGNSANNLVLAGFKMFVETGSNSFVEILNRKIPLQAAKRWYDIPLCDIEILKVYLMKQVQVKVTTPNPSRYPIKLFHFEIFGMNLNTFSLDSKLSELAKSVHGFSSQQDQVQNFSSLLWTQQAQLLRELPQSQRELVIYSNTLACSLVEPVSEIPIQALAVSAFSGPCTLYSRGLRQALKNLLSGTSKRYLLLKGLVQTNTLQSTPQPSSQLASTCVKTLSKLAKEQTPYLFYLFNCVPKICEQLDCALSVQDKIFYFEELLKILLAKVQYTYCKALGSIQSDTEKLKAAYDLTPGVVNYEYEMITKLIYLLNASNKDECMNKLYQTLKKKTRTWIKSIKSQHVPKQKVQFLDQEDIYGVPSADLNSQILKALQKKETELSLVTPDNCYLLIYYLSQNWKCPLNKLETKLKALNKQVRLLEKVWISEKLQDPRYFSLLSQALNQQIQEASPFEKGPLHFLYFCTIMTSLKASKNKKLHKSIVGSLVKAVPQQILESIFEKIGLTFQRFSNGEGSRKAIYRNEFLEEVLEENDTLQLMSAEDSLIFQEWEAEEQNLVEPDQLLTKTLVELAYNLISGVGVELEKQSQVLEYLEGFMDVEEKQEFSVKDEWKQMLCQMLMEPSFDFVHSSVEKLLQAMFESQERYSEYVSMAKLSRCILILESVGNRTQNFKFASYQEISGVHQVLIEIKNVLKDSPEVWPHFFSRFLKDTEIFKTFISLSVNFGSEIAQECLSIIVGVLDYQRIESNSELKSQLEHNFYIWNEFLEFHFPCLIERLSLDGDVEFAERLGELIFSLASIANELQEEKLLKVVLDRMKTFVNLGYCSTHILSQLVNLMNRKNYSSEVMRSFCSSLIEGLENSTKAINRNPNSKVYDELMTLFGSSGFNSFILDSEPCLRCFKLGDNSSNHQKIADIQTEARFSESAYYFRLKEPYKTYSIDVKLTETRGHKAIRGCSVYYCNETTDLLELKNNWSHWQKLKEVKVKPNFTDHLVIELPSPVILLNVLIQFTTVNVIRLSQDELSPVYTSRYLSGRARYNFLSGSRGENAGKVVGVSVGNEREVLPCPRCNKPVEDKYGICGCGENAFQCLQCRNINYENLDAFLCNECGESRYCKIEIGIKCHPDALYETIHSQEDLTKAQNKIDSYQESIQCYYENLQKTKDNLHSMVQKLKGYSSAKDITENSSSKELSPVVLALTQSYNSFQESYYETMINVKSVVALKQAMLNYQSPQTNFQLNTSPQLTPCYGCNFFFLKKLLTSLRYINNPTLIRIIVQECRIVSILVQDSLRSYSQFIRKKARRALAELVTISKEGCQELFGVIEKHINIMLEWKPFIIDSVREEVLLILELTESNSNLDVCLSPEDPEGYYILELTHKYFWKVFFKLLQKSWEDSRISDLVARFLNCILDMIYKTQVLKPSENLPEDPVMRDFFLKNPALTKNTPSPTNLHTLFVAHAFSSKMPEVYSQWQRGQLDFQTWKNYIAEEAAINIKRNWLLDCVIYSESSKVQDQSLLILLCLASSGLWKEVLDSVLDAIPQALCNCKQGADYYFTLLSKLLIKDYLEESSIEKLLKEIDNCVEDVLNQQNQMVLTRDCSVKISLGHGLVCLLHLLSGIVDNEWGKKILINNKQLANSVINSFLNSLKIQFVKNKVIAESQEFLEKLFDQLHLESFEEQKSNFLLECIEALFQRHNDPLAQSFIIQNITRIIAPSKPEPLYYLRLEKTPTQEEYIRGSMERNPYSSKEIGPLMNNVRSRICRELELSDPELLEMLVAGQIISPNLSVADVYEHVLWPNLQEGNSRYSGKHPNDFSSEELPQMVVTYRLAGLDGEATEDIVDSIPAHKFEQEDPETKYSTTKVMSIDIQGQSMIEYCLKLIKEGSDQQLQACALKLLYYSCQISVNRLKLCEVKGIPLLFEILSNSSQVEPFLNIVDLLVSDSQTQHIISQDCTPMYTMIFLLRQVSSDHTNAAKINALLPYLCHGNFDACKALVEYFQSQIKLDTLINQEIDSHEVVKVWVQLLDNLPATHTLLRDAFLNSGVTQQLINTFEQMDPQRVHPKNMVVALKALKGLLVAHPPSQTLLESSLVESIFNLKKVPYDIGPAAEMLIEAILSHKDQSDPAVSDLLQIMSSIEEEKRKEKAAQKREEVLKQFQMPDLSQFNVLEEELGLACVICKEGYTLRPDDLLGFYIYVSAANVLASIDTPDSDADYITAMNLVTHFNPIHLSCHKEAAKAEKNMKRPKGEWEGASIRNQHTRCNNWLPIWGPQIPRHDYESAVQKMFAPYPMLTSRYLLNECHDIRIQLHRFSYEESFSKESKGGGPEHNLQALPYMLQLCWFLMETEELNYQHTKEVMSNYMAADQLEKDQLFYLMTLCFLNFTKQEWQLNKLLLFQKATKVAKKNLKTPSKLLYVSQNQKPNPNSLQTLANIRPFLVCIKLIDLHFSVLFMDTQEPFQSNAKNYLQSADPSIQDRSLAIYEEYKRFLSLDSLEACLSSLSLLEDVLQTHDSLAQCIT